MHLAHMKLLMTLWNASQLSLVSSSLILFSLITSLLTYTTDPLPRPLSLLPRARDLVVATVSVQPSASLLLVR